MRDVISEFREAMISEGITPPEAILADGILHRFKINGKKNGWYVFYNENIPAGAFGDWRRGISSKWCAKRINQMSAIERKAHSTQMKIATKQREAVVIQEQTEAVKRAQSIWHASIAANPAHLYLLKKRISPFYARQRGDSLVLPVTDFEEHICSLQFISPEGTKMFLKGGAKKGRFISVNGFSGERKLICEGFATGATLAQAYPDTCVIAAMDAGNLEAVALAARERWPDAEILICADDDRLTAGNPGVAKARKAAMSASAKFTVPEWPPGVPEVLTDFNDLACWISDNLGAI